MPTTPHEIGENHCNGCTCRFNCKCGSHEMVFNHDHGVWVYVEEVDDYQLAMYESHSPSSCQIMEWREID